MGREGVWRHSAWRVLVSAACLVALVATAGTAWGTPVRAAAGPVLTLEPERGPCDVPAPVVIARGSNFPPGRTISLMVWRQFPFSDSGAEGATVFVAADGTFTTELRLAVCGPDDINGARFRVTAQTREGRDIGPILASAIFTLTASPSGPLCFTQTSQCIRGRFLDYWLRNGGLEINGYPLSDEFEQRLEDGNTYTVQYFERTRLEHHPEHAGTLHEVLLGQFGRRIHPADPPARRQEGAVYFPETGHNLSGKFLAYWQGNGGLAQFGYPISEEFRETLEDGNEYTVQYFERARFELHWAGGIVSDYIVVLGQFGRRILAESGR